MACGAPDVDDRESASQGTRRRKHARLDERLASIEASMNQLIQMQSNLSGKVQVLEGVGNKMAVNLKNVDNSVKACQYTMETRMSRIEGLLFASDFATFHKIDEFITAASALPPPFFETPTFSAEACELPFVPAFPCRGGELTSHEPADGMNDKSGMDDKKGDVHDMGGIGMIDKKDVYDKGTTNDRDDTDDQRDKNKKDQHTEENQQVKPDQHTAETDFQTNGTDHQSTDHQNTEPDQQAD